MRVIFNVFMVFFLTTEDTEEAQRAQRKSNIIVTFVPSLWTLWLNAQLSFKPVHDSQEIHRIKSCTANQTAIHIRIGKQFFGVG